MKNAHHSIREAFTSTRQRGVTLIELMITIVIVGILASIAVPSYQNYVRQAARAEAKGILLETVQFLERNYTTANRYDEDSSGDDIVLPFDTSPKSGTAKYDIEFDDLTAQSYILQAVPTLAFPDPDCGTLTISHTGAQTANDISTPAILATCWGR
jgi:type IV pilus assembly protein PilE